MTALQLTRRKGARWNSADLQRALDGPSPPLHLAHRAGQTHAAYGWSMRPGVYAGPALEAYRAGYRGAPLCGDRLPGS